MLSASAVLAVALSLSVCVSVTGECLVETVGQIEMDWASCFRLSICIEFVYVYFPVIFCLSVSVEWLAVKTASEMTYIVSSGALNSTPTNFRLSYAVF